MSRWAVLTAVSGITALAIGHGWGYGLACLATAIAVMRWLTLGLREEPLWQSEDRGGHVRVLEDEDA